MKIRIWSGCMIVCDLDVNQQGYGTWYTRPNMPNNEVDSPDLEIDPWAQLVRVGRKDVEMYGSTDD